MWVGEWIRYDLYDGQWFNVVLCEEPVVQWRCELDDGHLMLVAVPPSNLTQSMASSPLMPHAHHTHATKTMEPSRSICSIWNPYPTPISMLMDVFLWVPTLPSFNVEILWNKLLPSFNVEVSMQKTAGKMDKQEVKRAVCRVCKTFCLNIIVIRCRLVDIWPSACILPGTLQPLESGEWT